MAVGLGVVAVEGKGILGSMLVGCLLCAAWLNPKTTWKPERNPFGPELGALFFATLRNAKTPDHSGV